MRTCGRARTRLTFHGIDGFLQNTQLEVLGTLKSASSAMKVDCEKCGKPFMLVREGDDGAGPELACSDKECGQRQPIPPGLVEEPAAVDPVVAS